MLTNDPPQSWTLSEAVPIAPTARAMQGAVRPLLFVCEAVSLAHLGRPLTLARWAREAGHEVEVACGEAFASIARLEGFEPHLLPTIPENVFFHRLAQGRFFYTEQELEEYVAAERLLMQSLCPRLVVGDFRLSLPISAAVAGIPSLALVNAYWSHGASGRLPPPDAGMLGLLPPRVRDLVFAGIMPLAVSHFAQPVDAVRRRHGQPKLRDFRRHYCAGTWCGYLDLPSLVPVRRLPAGHFYLGPLPWQPSGLAAPDLVGLGQQRPLAYLSLGSSGDSRLLPELLAALLNCGCDIALSGMPAEGANALRKAVPALRGRLVAAQLFAPDEVLRRAALTICHGGSGTIYQSLAAGVPILCLPGNPDQQLASRALVLSGAGLSLRREDASVDRVAPRVARILHDGSFVKRARAMRTLLAAHDTRGAWLRFLDGLRPAPYQAADSTPRPAARWCSGERAVRDSHESARSPACRPPACGHRGLHPGNRAHGHGVLSRVGRRQRSRDPADAVSTRSASPPTRHWWSRRSPWRSSVIRRLIVWCWCAGRSVYVRCNCTWLTP